MNFYEASNPADITSKEIIRTVKEYLPDCKKSDLKFFYHGTYNVFRIRNEFIIRVPDRAFRNKKGLAILRHEKKILDFLIDKLPHTIPKIMYLNENPELPLSIHKMISGESLIYYINNLSADQKRIIGKQIGEFLSILHSIELRDKFIETFPNESNKLTSFMKNYRSNWRSRFKEIKKYAFEFLTKKQKKWLTNVFNLYLSDNGNFEFTPVLAHCDFDTSNILFNNNKGVISGIIDFEECKITDPAVDLLFFKEGTEFLKNVLENYRYAKQKNLRNRMQFYFCRTCASYLVWGIKHNRKSMIDEGLKKIRVNMKLFPMFD